MGDQVDIEGHPGSNVPDSDGWTKTHKCNSECRVLIIFSKVSCPKKLEDSGHRGCPEATHRSVGTVHVHIEELVSVRRGRRRREVVSAAGGQFSEKVNSEDPNPIQIQSKSNRLTLPLQIFTVQWLRSSESFCLWSRRKQLIAVAKRYQWWQFLIVTKPSQLGITETKSAWKLCNIFRSSTFAPTRNQSRWQEANKLGSGCTFPLLQDLWQKYCCPDSSAGGAGSISLWRRLGLPTQYDRCLCCVEKPHYWVTVTPKAGCCKCFFRPLHWNIIVSSTYKG